MPVAASIVVEVTDAHHEPVSDAELAVSFDDEVVALGHTRVDGACEVQISRGSHRRLHCTHTGYASASIWLPDSDLPARLVVQLGDDAWIRGAFRTPAGAPITGARVVAWAESDRPELGYFRCIGKYGERLPGSTQTDVNGHFELHGLSAHVRYALYAFNRTWATPEIRPHVEANGDTIDLIGWKLLGLVVHVREQDGGFPEADPQVWPCECNTSSAAPSVKYRALHGFDSPIAYMDADLAPLFQQWSTVDRPLLYCTPEDVDSFGPISMRVCIPGYSQEDCTLWARSFRDGLPEQQITVRSIASQRVDLNIEFKNCAMFRSQVHTAAGPMFCIFLRDRRTGDTAEVECHSIGETKVIHGLPLSEYLVDLASEGYQAPNFDQPLTTRAVVGGLSAEIDVGGYGGVNLHVLDIAQAEQRTAMSCSLYKGAKDGPRERTFYFERFPYTALGLLPGEYRVDVQSPGSSTNGVTHSAVFVVQPGLVTEAVCTALDGAPVTR